MILRGIVVLLALTMSGWAHSAQGLTCPDAGTFSQGGIVSKVCWPCFFPILIGPVPIGGSMTGYPDDDVAPTCTCPGRVFGYPTTGPRLAMWQPTQVIETVRHPFCSPTLGGISLTTANAASVASLTLLGGAGGNQPGAGAGGSAGQTETDPGAFYNFHQIMFPLSAVLDTISDSVCVSESGSDIDIGYMSEIDPTWNNEELALFTHPEAVLFTSLPAVTACMADSVASTLYKPIQALFWCAGASGHGYPFSGISTAGSPPRATSHVAQRALAALHRRGIANKTYNGLAVCRDHPWPTLPKQQYKFQVFYPIPEVLTNHWMGASPHAWSGGQVTIPGVGEDFVYLIWTWQACCGNF